ncbi:hypothetical protein N431DRAFT_434808 [Stipitochalara longipes BDJ]|nr:hypothetical protein N431DRAFT_434808 [Stipitochalara longipes BDJ]
MAMAPNHLAQASSLECEVAGCTATFRRVGDRRRHVTEKHGPPTRCRVPDCKWSAKRKARLRGHLENFHPGEANQTYLLNLPVDFQPGSPQSPASNQTSTDPALQWQQIEPGTSDASLYSPTSPQVRLNYPRASRPPTGTQSRVYRAIRRRKPASLTSCSSRKQENQLSFQTRQEIAESPVDVELLGMVTSIWAFVLDLDMDMDVEDNAN